MATGDKADLLAKLSENITDNGNNENTASRHRSYASKIITYCANLVEATKQVFLGEIGFNEQVTFSKNPTYLGNPIYQEALVKAHCDYSTTTEVNLTVAEQKVTDWGVTGNLLPVGVTVSDGTFTVTESAIFNTGIERTYLNYDRDPTVPVIVSLRVVATYNGTTAEIMNRTLPISASTAINEPGSLTPFSRQNLQIPAGTTFEVFVSANEGGADPEDVRLVRMGISANSIYNLEVAQ